MEYRVKRSSLRGEVYIPPSKSQTIRALIFAMMAKGTSKVHNYLHSPDIFDLLEIMRLFSVSIHTDDDVIEIQGLGGKIPPAEDILHVGNSGLVYRFFTALAALGSQYTVITGDASIRHLRPINHMLETLATCGVFAKSCRGDGHAPILIKGPMKPGVMAIEGNDSQPVSALLLATSFLKGESEIFVTSPGEKPWIDMTLHWLKRFQIKVKNDDYRHYYIKGGATIDGFEYVVPGDFSTAAFPIVAALITRSSVTITGLDMSDMQGDKKLIATLQKLGAKIDYNKKQYSLHVYPTETFNGGEIHVNDMIDATPILALFGCFTKHPLHLVGAEVARKKESNRLATITEELGKMGAKIEETPDGLIIQPSKLQGARVSSHNDHRIAMTLFVAGLGASGVTTVDGIECIAKTYPTMYQDFSSLGVKIG